MATPELIAAALSGSKAAKAELASKGRKVRSMSFDEAQDWQFAQRTQPEAEQVAWFATFAAFKEGKVTRTKAQRAFRRAFPEDCTENFDGICRCR